MYEYVDRPVTSLDPGSRLLVWLMRNWVRSVHARRCPCTAIGTTFVQYDMPDALPHFQMMMLTINREASEKFGFGDVHCNHVLEHEALLISLMQRVPQSSPDAMRTMLGVVVAQDAVATLYLAMSAFADEMVNAGILPASSAA